MPCMWPSRATTQLKFIAEDFMVMLQVFGWASRDGVGPTIIYSIKITLK